MASATLYWVSLSNKLTRGKLCEQSACFSRVAKADYLIVHRLASSLHVASCAYEVRIGSGDCLGVSGVSFLNDSGWKYLYSSRRLSSRIESGLPKRQKDCGANMAAVCQARISWRGQQIGRRKEKLYEAETVMSDSDGLSKESAPSDCDCCEGTGIQSLESEGP